jgi:hypothetical protein
MFPTVEELSLCAETDYTAIFTDLRQQESSNELLWPRLQRVAITPSSSTMLGSGRRMLSDILRIITDYIDGPGLSGTDLLIKRCPLCTEGMQLRWLGGREACQ